MNRKSGFTIIETFLVAALFGIILVTIFSSYTAGIRIWTSVRNLKLIEDRKFTIASEKMKKEIMSYIRKFDKAPLKGDKKKLSFPVISRLEIVEVNYVFDKGEKAILRKEKRISESLKDKINIKTSELFKCQDIAFNYLIYNKESKVGSWVNNFSIEDEQALKAIRIDIKQNNATEAILVFIPE